MSVVQKKVYALLEPDEVEALIASAKANTRSISQEVRHRIKESLAGRVQASLDSRPNE